MSLEQEPGWLEPGVERHAWESEYEALLPLLRDEPEEALPELAALVERMLVQRGHPAELGGALDDSEEAVAFASAREVAERVRAGEDADPGDVAFAVEQLRAVYESLVREAPSA